MSKQPEAKLSERVVAALCKLPGCRAEKRHGSVFGTNTLDITGSIDGFAFEIETKMPGKEPTDRQNARMRMLKSFNIITGWYDNVEDAVKIVREGYERQLARIRG